MVKPKELQPLPIGLALDAAIGLRRDEVASLAVLRHRILTNFKAEAEIITVDKIIEELL